MVAWLNALCLGDTNPHRFRDSVKHIIAMQAHLRGAKVRMMRKRIDDVRNKDTEALLRAHESSMSKESNADIRLWLKAKHQRQHQEMLGRLSAVEQELEAIVDGQRDAFDCVKVADFRPPDTGVARQLIQEFDAECERAVAVAARHEQEAREVRTANSHTRQARAKTIR